MRTQKSPVLGGAGLFSDVWLRGQPEQQNPDIAARLRSFAYNLLRATGCDNIKNARWRAALDLNLVLAMPGLA